jgi:6-phosphogluconolactonase
MTIYNISVRNISVIVGIKTESPLRRQLMQSRRTILLGLFAAAAASSFHRLPATANDYGPQRVGTVYTASNAEAGNAILAFDQFGDGSMRAVGTTVTGGTGTGKGLGNQSGITLSPDRRWLFAVNAGSNEISVFKFADRLPKLVSKVSSGGVRPVSLTIQGDDLYVVNAGSDDVVGFELKESGQLKQRPNSKRSLSGKGTAPAQIRFSPDGRFVVVTEKATNLISVFPTYREQLGQRVSTPSTNKTPFGFAFDRQGDLLVSEAEGGAPNGSWVSSYRLQPNGRVQPIKTAETKQTAACWVVVTGNGKYAYASNTGSGTLSGFDVQGSNLKALNADGKTGVTGDDSKPIDLVISRNGQFLNSLNSGNGTISALQITAGGALKNAFTLKNIPAGANGLAVR